VATRRIPTYNSSHTEPKPNPYLNTNPNANPNPTSIILLTPHQYRLKTHG